MKSQAAKSVCLTIVSPFKVHEINQKGCTEQRSFHLYIQIDRKSNSEVLCIREHFPSDSWPLFRNFSNLHRKSWWNFWRWRCSPFTSDSFARDMMLKSMSEQQSHTMPGPSMEKMASPRSSFTRNLGWQKLHCCSRDPITWQWSSYLLSWSSLSLSSSFITWPGGDWISSSCRQQGKQQAWHLRGRTDGM